MRTARILCPALLLVAVLVMAVPTVASAEESTTAKAYQPTGWSLALGTPAGAPASIEPAAALFSAELRMTPVPAPASRLEPWSFAAGSGVPPVAEPMVYCPWWAPCSRNCPMACQ